MAHRVTILMYHYVRNLQNSRYPRIKGLDFSKFAGQLLYLRKHYRFITADDLMNSLNGKGALPEKAVLLTFDDCYKDHFTYVFPLLVRYGLSAAFYAPMECIMEKKVLDVNKIHFILAATDDPQRLLKEIWGLLDAGRADYPLESNSFYWNKLAFESRWDPPEIVFIKKLLQTELPFPLRTSIVESLFNQYVSIDEETFWEELYLTKDHILCMQKAGMHFGSHGYGHLRLHSLSYEQQENEIAESLRCLHEIGVETGRWTMCYPYGAFNDDTLDLLNKYGCQFALTTEVDVYDANRDHRYRIPRLNTNDLPVTEDAAVNAWWALG